MFWTRDEKSGKEQKKEENTVEINGTRFYAFSLIFTIRSSTALVLSQLIKY